MGMIKKQFKEHLKKKKSWGVSLIKITKESISILGLTVWRKSALQRSRKKKTKG